MLTGKFVKKSFEGDGAFYKASFESTWPLFSISGSNIENVLRICHGCGWGKCDDRGTGNY